MSEIKMQLNDEELDAVVGGARKKAASQPQYMSIACSKCGEINMKIDIMQSSFVCDSCGKTNYISG